MYNVYIPTTALARMLTVHPYLPPLILITYPHSSHSLIFIFTARILITDPFPPHLLTVLKIHPYLPLSSSQLIPNRRTRFTVLITDPCLSHSPLFILIYI